MYETIFYRNLQLLILTILVIVVAGISAFFSLPRLEDPRISNRNPLVITTLPGATAERVETLVTKKIETVLRDLSEIKNLESQSRANVSFIQLELNDDIYDTEEVYTKIRDKLADIENELPANATTPEFDGERGALAYTLILSVAWEGNDSDLRLGMLNRTAQELADRMRNVLGTDLVRIYGAPQEEMRVELSRDRLTELGLTSEAITQRVIGSDSKVASGIFRSNHSDIVLEVDGAFAETNRISSIPVLSGSQGEVVRLDDIATVSKAWQDPPNDIAIADSQRAIYVAVRMLDDQRVDDWMVKANEAIREFDGSLSGSVAIQPVFQQQQYTSQRLGELGMNLLMGALVVVLVIFVMMGWRSALLVGLALPLVSAMVLFAMQLLGIPLHQMSIFGLIVVIGLLIDNAIVVVDDVTEKIQHGTSRLDAIQGTVGHLFVPLLGSTLTTVLAFMPIFLLPGNVGEFVGTIAVTVILALVFSFAVSMKVIPSLTGIFAKVDSSKRWWRRGIQVPWVTHSFKKTLTFLVSNPALGLLVAVSIPVIGFMRVGELRNQFFPGADRNQFHIQVWAAPQSSIKATTEIAKSLEQEVRRDDRVDLVDWLIGGSMPTVYYNLVMDQDDKPNYAQAIVTTSKPKHAVEMIASLQRDLDKEFPGAQIVVRQLAQGPPVEAPIEVRLYGPSVERLKQLGQQVQGVLYQTPSVLHTRTTFDVSRQKVMIYADESESRLAGVSLSNIAGQLQTSLEGAMGGSLLESTEELPVRVRFGDQIRGDLNQIASSRIQVPGTREWMPLEAVANLRLVPETSNIPRRNGERCNTIQAFVDVDALPPEVTDDFLARLDESGFELPAGYRLQVGGDSEELANSMANLFRYAPILAILMFATIVLSFRSFLLAGAILGVAGLSAGIGFLTLWVVGFPLGFNPLIGTAGLIGLAINDSIVVLSQIRSNQQARAGDVEQIATEVLSTGRHVISTTLTTIGGFVPLLLGGGTFWPPLAIVIAGGVGGATILATIYIPSAYALVRPFVESERKQELHVIQSNQVASDNEGVRPELSVAVLN